MSRYHAYDRVHYQLARARGRAREHACIDCGKPAREWSYRGGDPNEQVEFGRPFSLDIWYYDPRCRSCHLVYDRELRPTPPGLMQRMTVLATAANQGNQHTKGRVMPEHEKRHRSEANRGRPKTRETKERMRKAALRRWARQRGEVA